MIAICGGVMVAYVVIVFCYFSVAIIEYLMVNSYVEKTILITLYHTKWLIALASMFVIVHLISSYQVCV